MIKTIIYVFLGLSAFVLSAQIGGQNAYQFLTLVSSPRQAALGGKVLTNNDWDVSQALHNPAAINDEMDGKIALNFVNYFADITYGSMAFSKSFSDKKHLFAGGITYIDYGTFAGYDEFGTQTEDFTGNEFALTVGYRHAVANSNLKIGANVKLISSKLAEFSSIGAAIDLALLYDFKDKNSQLTLVASNIGKQFTAFDDIKENIPFHVDLAFAKKLENLPLKFHVVYENLQQWDVSFINPARATVDLNGVITPEKVSVVNNFMRHIIIGAELFHGKAINLRVGYNFRRGNELLIEGNRVFSGLTAGFGVKLKRFRVNYAFQKYSAATSVHAFGLNINLDNN